MASYKALSGVRVLTQRKITEGVSTKAETRTVVLTQVFSILPRGSRFLILDIPVMMYHFGIRHAVDIAARTTREHARYTHVRNCPRVSG
jgi:hypothetical protein